jgi:hypothetical protein
MRLLALALGLCSLVHCARFPRATKGNGFLKIPVGTVDRPARKVKRGESPLVTVLENMDFFYATDSMFHKVLDLRPRRL